MANQPVEKPGTVENIAATACYLCENVGPADLLLPLLLITAISLARIANKLRQAPWAHSRPWWTAIAIVIAFSAATFVLAQDYAGIVAFGLTVLLLVLPVRLMTAAFASLGRDNARRAIALARLGALLHPTAARREQARFIRLLATLRSGIEPKAEIEHFSANDPDMAKLLPALVDHINGDVESVLRRLESAPVRERLLSLGFGLAYIRAVAVIQNDGDAIAAAFHAFARVYPQLQEPESMALLAVFLPALVGDVATARHHAELLQTYLGPTDSAIVHALAIARAGDREAGIQTLKNAAESFRNDPISSHRIAAYQRVLKVSVDHPPSPSQALNELLELLRRQAPRLAESAAIEGRGADRLPLTWSIIALLVSVHLLVSVTGDTLDPVHLYAWGALATTFFSVTEAWRLLSATLLHAGLLHLLFNAFGLRFFGRFVEPLFGRARMAIIYIAAGALSSLAVAIFADPSSPHLLVGASGAILGLGGAILAASLRRPSLRKSRRGKEQIRGLVLIFIIQLGFDALLAAVSSTAHIAGFIVGFLFGLLLTPDAPSRVAASEPQNPTPARR